MILTREEELKEHLVLSDLAANRAYAIGVATERARCARIVESGICDGLSYEDKALMRAAAEIRQGE